MELLSLIIKFLILTALASGIIVFFLHRTLISSTDGAVKRLNEEIAKANEKQAELTQKIKEADEELAKRREEAKELANKMRTDAEEESKATREKIITKAREESEEIIAKAQNAKEKIREELEKEMDTKAVNFSIQILNDILSEKSKAALDNTLVGEFLEKLEGIDMSRISEDVKSADVITLGEIPSDVKTKMTQIVKKKLNRDIALNASTDPNIGGGVVLKFGSMALDGSVKNLIREAAISIQESIDTKAA